MTPHELWLTLRAIGIVLADSNRTDQIHIVEEITGKQQFEQALRDSFDSTDGRALLREHPELNSAQIDYDKLRALPEGSLGKGYVDHLDKNGLSADAQAAMTTHVDDPTLSYLIRRFRQTHDVWHALTNLGINGHEEVIIHAFTYGQLRLPVSALILFFGTLKHIVLEGRKSALRHALFEAFEHGRQAMPLLPVYWEHQWAEPIAKVRARYGVVPCTRAYVDN